MLTELNVSPQSNHHKQRRTRHLKIKKKIKLILFPDSTFDPNDKMKLPYNWPKIKRKKIDTYIFRARVRHEDDDRTETLLGRLFIIFPLTFSSLFPPFRFDCIQIFVFSIVFTISSLSNDILLFIAALFNELLLWIDGFIFFEYIYNVQVSCPKRNLIY